MNLVVDSEAGLDLLWNGDYAIERRRLTGSEISFVTSVLRMSYVAAVKAERV